MKTAIEWLFEQLEEKGDLRETSSIRNIQLNIDTSDYLELKRQAKQMEKEQIIEAWIVSDNPLQRIEAEKYYNITYKQ